MEAAAAAASTMFLLQLVFFLGLILLLLLAAARICKKPPYPYPPGPRGLPLIGNMLMLNQLTHQGLANLAKQYGGILHLRLGLLHVVSVSTPEIARVILQEQDLIFSNKPATIAIKYLTYDQADMAFGNYGPFWRQMRKLFAMKLFSRRRAQSWASVQDEVESAIRTVASKCGTQVNIGELMLGVTNNITYRAAFASNLLEGKDEFALIMKEFSQLFSAFNIADFFPGLSWIDPHRLNSRLTKARLSLDRFIDDIVDDHLAKKKKKKKRDNTDDDDRDTDMVDELLAFYDGGQDDEAKESKPGDVQVCLNLNRDNIKAIVLDVMFGGTETIAAAIEWVMTELMKNPEEVKRVQEELNDVVGQDRIVQDSDLNKLTYLKCIIKETLRLHPPIPLLLHETTKDTKVFGYYIPARSRVLVNVWALGRDKFSWDDPDVFRPTRFLTKDIGNFNQNDFEFLPFGAGRRSCPAMQFALYAVELALAHLLHCFSWDLPDGMKLSEVDMSDVFGVTAPKAIRLIVIPRPRLHFPLP